MVIGNKQIQTIENKQISTIENSEYSIFIKHIEVFFSHHMENHSFWIINISRFSFNNEFVYIWQNVKGDICYSFNLMNKEYYSTSATKLGNLLSNHFKQNIEIINNIDDDLKKNITATSGVLKALTDSNRYDYISSFGNNESSNSTDIEIDKFGQKIKSNLPIYNQGISTEKILLNNAIDISINRLSYNKQTIFIHMNKLQVIHKEVFKPNAKLLFYVENGLIYKNSYLPSMYMISNGLKNVHNSFIVSFIFYMAKSDCKKAINILYWLSSSFNLLAKLPFVLVLFSEEDIYMQLFYEEIIEPLFNSDYCERIDNSDLDKKILSNKLNNKVMYNFHNITSPIILDAPAKEFTKKLLHNDNFKLNNKAIPITSNIIITSTSKYMPLISNDLPSVLIHAEFSLENFCKKMNIKSDYYTVVNLIKNDLLNFSQILKSFNILEHNHIYNLEYYNRKSSELNIMDYDTDLLLVFNNSIKNKDISFFKMLENNAKRLYKELIMDFTRNRVNRSRLIDYFIGIFGENIYTKKNYRSLISDLRSLSNTEEPFNNKETFQIGKEVYYSI